VNNLNIIKQRIYNQQIAHPGFTKPGDVAAWMGAIQAQDYAASKWAVGLRGKGLTDVAIEEALTKGTIVRTHVLRPTWHLVSPVDIRWMLALTAPRINAFAAYYHRKLGLDNKIFKRSNAVLEKILQGGKQLTRKEIESAFTRARIATDDLRFIHLMLHAELDAVVCNGGRQGKQFTYALLDERVPAAETLHRDEALAELTGRYFKSHGPATLQDFSWWSGLTTADAKKGIEMIKPTLMHEVVDGNTYWFSSSLQPAKNISRAVYLLPNFDEYIVSYANRGAIFGETYVKKIDPRNLFNNAIIINGMFAGNWKRVLKKDSVEIALKPFSKLSKANTDAVIIAAKRYGKFLGLPAVVAFK